MTQLCNIEFLVKYLLLDVLQTHLYNIVKLLKRDQKNSNLEVFGISFVPESKIFTL